MMSMSARSKDILTLVVFVLICQAAGGIGGLFTATSVGTWYAALRKPPYNPPGWIFGPVWTVLYALMGVAAWLVVRRGWNSVAVKAALAAFVAQLVLNMLWSAVFFGMRSPGIAFIELLGLWVAILVTIRLFWRVSPTAGALLVPYVLWVSFAAVLNYSIWRLNR
jgi:benzodiazapine receptor